jgi:hypothetical protein
MRNAPGGNRRRFRTTKEACKVITYSKRRSRARDKLRLLPYGCYQEAGGVVIHDRDYRPVVRLLGEALAITVPAHTRDRQPCLSSLPLDNVQPCDPNERITFTGQTWFYCDRTSPRHDRATRRRLEKLIDAVPALKLEIERRKQTA